MNPTSTEAREFPTSSRAVLRVFRDTVRVGFPLDPVPPLLMVGIAVCEFERKPQGHNQASPAKDGLWSARRHGRGQGRSFPFFPAIGFFFFNSVPLPRRQFSLRLVRPGLGDL